MRTGSRKRPDAEAARMAVSIEAALGHHLLIGLHPHAPVVDQARKCAEALAEAAGLGRFLAVKAAPSDSKKGVDLLLVAPGGDTVASAAMSVSPFYRPSMGTARANAKAKREYAAALSGIASALIAQAGYLKERARACERESLAAAAALGSKRRAELEFNAALRAAWAEKHGADSLPFAASFGKLKGDLGKVKVRLHSASLTEDSFVIGDRITTTTVGHLIQAEGARDLEGFLKWARYYGSELYHRTEAAELIDGSSAVDAVVTACEEAVLALENGEEPDLEAMPNLTALAVATAKALSEHDEDVDR